MLYLQKKLKMYKYLILGFLILFAFSCDRDDDDAAQQLEDDIEIIENYIAENNLIAESTPSGLHYVVLEEGNGSFPIATSRVVVNYKGYFLDGEEFDSGNGIQFFLTEVIRGWTEGIPKFSKGGSGILLIPSYLAYGPNGRGAIPGNTVLAFDILLDDFN